MPVQLLARSIMSLPLALLADLVATSQTFRKITGRHDSQGASEHIYFPYASDRIDKATGEPEAPLPRVMIQPGPNFSRQQRGTSYGAGRGNCFLSFEFLPDDMQDGARPDELLDFMNEVGMILEEIEERQGSDKQHGEAIFTPNEITHLNMVGYLLVDGPGECIRSNENDLLFYGAVFLVDWLG